MVWNCTTGRGASAIPGGKNFLPVCGMDANAASSEILVATDFFATIPA